MTLTGTVDNTNALIELFVDFTTEPGVQTFGTLTRHEGAVDAPGQYVRGLYLTNLLGEMAYVFDAEAPLDTPVWYTAEGFPGAVVMTAGPFTINSGGLVWMKDPGRPWANVSLDLCITPTNGLPEACVTPPEPPLAWVGFGDKVRSADAGLFPVLNDERPADVYARRKNLVSSIRFLSRTLDAIDSVYELYTAGGVLFLQLPAVYGWDDDYVQPGDLTEAYLSRDQRRPWRLWDAPVTLVDVPIGEPQGTDAANWCEIKDDYPTFADLTATGLTWGQIAAGDGDI